MIHRYTIATLALLAATSATPVQAQINGEGACCFVPPQERSRLSGVLTKDQGISTECTETNIDSCEEGLLGTFAGEGTSCGPQVFYGSEEDCLADVVGLPVELATFDATVSGHDVILEWTTSSESENAGFSVETEVAASEFAEVAFVEGHGTTRDQHEYRVVVEDRGPGLHRFRLKQLDFDGTFAYSSVVEAAVTVPDQFLIDAAYPNPFNPSTTVGFAVAAEQHVDVTLFNAAGQEIQSLYSGIAAPNQMQRVTVDAGGLPSGSYFVQFIGNGISATEQIVLSK